MLIIPRGIYPLHTAKVGNRQWKTAPDVPDPAASRFVAVPMGPGALLVVALELEIWLGCVAEYHGQVYEVGRNGWLRHLLPITGVQLQPVARGRSGDGLAHCCV